MIVMFQSLSILLLGKNGWDSQLMNDPTPIEAPVKPTSSETVLTQDERSLLAASSSLPLKSLSIQEIEKPSVLTLSPTPAAISPAAMTPVEETILASKREGAHVGVLLEHTFQIGMCLMTIFANELGGRHIQRTLLLFQILTFATVTYESLQWLVPIGYNETKAKAEAIIMGAMLGLMFTCLCCDCCAGADGEKT
jgi:hypothetical protein